LSAPSPCIRSDRKSRGYNQAALLAKQFARITGLPYEENLLVRCRHTDSQVELDAAARQENVAGAFAPTGRFATPAARAAGR
jgi:predicted amidophosphoribosyltransferase